jgi:uncharacterized Tic20 family protein
MTTEIPAVPTQDERVMAALCHVSAIIPTLGIIAPIVIWVTQKDKSHYVYIQSLQAIAYHITMIVCFILGMGCYMLSIFANFFGMFFPAEINNSISPMFFAGVLFPILVFGLIFLGWFAFILYAVIATVMTFQGRNFRYFIIGRLIEKLARK